MVLSSPHSKPVKDDLRVKCVLRLDKDEIKYLRIAYDNTNDLIELVESFRDTINCTRDLYMASISMQMND
jgi:magnesium transporter